MVEELDNSKQSANRLAEQVGAKADRKLKAQRNPAPGVWFGLGLMGIVGWSVVVPTLLGAALGVWLDRHYPGGRSWTLALMAAGLTLGCFNAWHWVSKEDAAMHQEPEDHDGP
ncbi:MAG: AtpZ/AtpI family protein [Rhodoferax sp.]